MDSFIYSINATVPIFLVMIVGWVIKQLGVIDEHFVSKANKYVFHYLHDTSRPEVPGTN